MIEHGGSVAEVGKLVEQAHARRDQAMGRPIRAYNIDTDFFQIQLTACIATHFSEV